MPSIPVHTDSDHRMIRSAVRRAVRIALEDIDARHDEIAREAMLVSVPRLDETDELVLITAGYELADRLYAKATRR